MSKKDILTNLSDHSAAKIRLLSLYLNKFITVISNDGFTKGIKIYDLFCGKGLYENDKEGSPLAILRIINGVLSKNSLSGKVNPKIECHFNDINVENVENLKKVIDEKKLNDGGFNTIKFTSNDYQDEVSKLVKEISTLKNQKAFVFIDPFGYGNIKAGEIKELLIHKNAEVLLFLPIQFMYRFDKNGTPEALYDFIKEIVDYKDWKENDNVWKFKEQLTDSFKKFLGQSFFVSDFSIQKDPRTVFSLFFFCSHIYGFEKMLETKWDIDKENGRGWDYTGNMPTLFFHVKTNPLEEKLIEFLRNADKSNGEVYEFTLNCGYLPRHCFEVLENLQTQGRLKVFMKDGKEARKHSFYISYKNYKYEFNKVKIKIL